MYRHIISHHKKLKRCATRTPPWVNSGDREGLAVLASHQEVIPMTDSKIIKSMQLILDFPWMTKKSCFLCKTTYQSTVCCHFQGKIYRWDASEEGEYESFAKIVQRVCFLFFTPASLCNHLHDKAKHKVSLNDFSLIVLDECHHVGIKKCSFNEIMNYYRRQKYGPASKRPQVITIKY